MAADWWLQSLGLGPRGRGDYGAGEQSHMIIHVTYEKICILSPVSSAISKPLVKFHSLC